MIRVCTFNVENLFARFNFKKNAKPMKDGFTVNDLAFDIYNDQEKKITAQAILEVNADIICLQEVESLSVLDKINTTYLKKCKYKYSLLIESHDPRFINVAVLSRFPVTQCNTHRHERNKANNSWLFSRDCFEVSVDVKGKTLDLFVNHFKSMIGGRDETKARRVEQVARVAEIMEARYKKTRYKNNFVVLGDFNDYMDAGSSLTKLVKHAGVENVLERLPKEEQWTHYYKDKKEYRQLDYLLLSKGLAAKNAKAKPALMRKGLPLRALKYTGARFKGVGKDNPKSSDHCPLFMDMELC